MLILSEKRGPHAARHDNGWGEPLRDGSPIPRGRSCYAARMLTGRPSDRTPREPPRPKRDADAFLLVASIVGFFAAVFIVAYALVIR